MSKKKEHSWFFVHKDKIGNKVNENALKERKWGNEINFIVSIYID